MATTKRKPAERKPAGRPSPIDAIVGTHPETGQPVTVADRIVNVIRAGTYFEPACIGSGISKDTGYEWLKVAGRVRLRARGRPVDELDPPPTAHERRCVAFSDAVDEAQGLWEIGANTDLERLGRGGIQVVIVTEKTDGQGNVVERTTRTETLAPNAQVLQWRLTRKFPGRYSERIVVDGRVDGTVEHTVGERADALGSALEAYLAGQRDEQARAKTDG